MTPLTAAEFSAFFEAVHDVPPFPWQKRLLEQVVANGRWPDLLDLPTGSGKTAALDIAIFHLALAAENSAIRRAAMRIAFVVDRRLVVDDAFERALRIAHRLTDADAEGVLGRVAARLRVLAGEAESPLIVRRMRGGVPREDDWARSACQPTVLCSTVDQVGSRLLFRGYGVSDTMAPVHAGLLGSDCLILLDEAHLSEPFRQTVRAIATSPSLHGPDANILQVALLTATAGENGGQHFELTEADRANETLSRRLNACKPAALKPLSGAEDARGERFAEEALAAVAHLQECGVASPAVAVVVNRVARARAVFEVLQKAAKNAAPAINWETLLIIGAARGVDRDRVAKQLTRVKTNVAQNGAARLERPLVIVATQTIEAGADLDLDGLITEAAPLDALRQRFGRVNRAGREISPYGAVLAYSADLKGEDSVYGTAIGATWKALGADGAELDFGIAALDAMLAAKGFITGALAPLLAPKSDAPVLMPAHVDFWSETSPMPSCDPDPALFLHGPDRAPADVQLLWRADLDFSLPAAQLAELFTLAPPRAAETIELPVWAVRAWLAGGDADIADVASSEGPQDEPTRRPVFRWAGSDNPRTGRITATQIGPGDTIIVHSSYGGCDEYGWRPKKPERDQPDWTPDVYDAASRPFESRRFVLRIAEGLLEQAERQRVAGGAMQAISGEQAEAASLRAADAAARVSGVLDALGASPDTQAVLDALAPLNLPEPYTTFRERHLDVVRYRPAFPYRLEGEERRRGVVLIAPLRNLIQQPTDAVAITSQPKFSASTEDDEAASFIGHELRLLQHSTDVSTLVAAFATLAGLPELITADLALAGWLHDAGKADRRFQRLLAGGDPFAIVDGLVLAKSKEGRSPRGAWDRAGLPKHWRHEAFSVRLALANPRLREAHDPALVLWLIGTHHGYGRPFFPHADDADSDLRRLPQVDGLTPAALPPGLGPQSLGFEVDGRDWAALFADLKTRYGTWGLARLEAVLRLADHRASEAANGEVT
jgi:CRISPR-associated endonuclease/helicase Cas3